MGDTIKAIWKGSLSLGLVNIPVAVYPAVEPKAISFRELHKTCKTPLEHKRWCPTDKEEVAWEDVVKGFEIAKDQYVVITKEELEAAKLKTTSNIEIVQFVNSGEIDPIYYDKPYYLAPQKGGEKAFFLLKNVLATLGKVAIARFVLRNKEYIVAIYSYKKGLLMHTLHYSYEIRDMNEIEELKKKARYTKEEEKLAIALVKSQSSKFDIKKFKDRYAEALKEIIKAKLKGKKISMPKEKIEKAKELMEALKASIKKKK
ncbi:MAG: Ku protein [Nanoarchaeota archaeon]|nr:Ku protein [Nanoarchaeota archaeon]